MMTRLKTTKRRNFDSSSTGIHTAHGKFKEESKQIQLIIKGLRKDGRASLEPTAKPQVDPRQLDIVVVRCSIKGCEHFAFTSADYETRHTLGIWGYFCDECSLKYGLRCNRPPFCIIIGEKQT